MPFHDTQPLPHHANAAPDDMSLVVRALHFASKKHRLQRRKDALGIPYINHPIDVVHVLVTEGGVRDPIVIAAAILHDVLEDTDTSRAELRAAFGEELTEVVEEVSDCMWVSQRLRRRLQTNRASRASARAKLVKLADKVCNMRDLICSPPAGWQAEQKRQYSQWAKSVVDELRGTNERLERRFDSLFDLKP